MSRRYCLIFGIVSRELESLELGRLASGKPRKGGEGEEVVERRAYMEVEEDKVRVELGLLIWFL